MTALASCCIQNQNINTAEGSKRFGSQAIHTLFFGYIRHYRNRLATRIADSRCNCLTSRLVLHPINYHRRTGSSQLFCRHLANITRTARNDCYFASEFPVSVDHISPSTIVCGSVGTIFQRHPGENVPSVLFRQECRRVHETSPE